MIGDNRSGHFGLGHSQAIKTLTKINLDYNIIDIKCGKSFIIYIDDEYNYWFAGGSGIRDRKNTLTPINYSKIII